MDSVRNRELFIDVFNAIKARDFSVQLQDISPRFERWLEKNSASLSVIAFGDIKSPDDANKRTEIVLKLFLDPANLNPKCQAELNGLPYEYLVYKYISRYILATHKSPNFIAYLSLISFDSQYFDNLSPEAKTQIDKYKRDLSTEYKCGDIEFLNQQTIYGLITQRPKNIQTLNEWFHKLQGSFDRIDTDEFRAVYLPVLFQLLYSLCVMDSYKIMHNDFHSNNILISTLDKKVKLKYQVEDRKYEIITNQIVYIFDWDRAYIQALGQNQFTENEKELYCDYLGMCNEFRRGYDLYMCMCLLKFAYAKFMVDDSRYVKFLENSPNLQYDLIDEEYYAHPLYINEENMREFGEYVFRNTERILSGTKFLVLNNDQLKFILTRESYREVKDVRYAAFTISPDYTKIYPYKKYKCRMCFDVHHEYNPFSVLYRIRYFDAYENPNITPTWRISRHDVAPEQPPAGSNILLNEFELPPELPPPPLPPPSSSQYHRPVPIPSPPQVPNYQVNPPSPSHQRTPRHPFNRSINLETDETLEDDITRYVRASPREERDPID